MGAGASAWFSSRSQEKGPLQPAPLGVATPPASPTDTSAVVTPLPTLEESMPTGQGDASIPAESPQTEQSAAPEEVVPAVEDLMPPPEELMPAPEEPVSTPQPPERSN